MPGAVISVTGTTKDADVVETGSVDVGHPVMNKSAAVRNKALP
jgi:hypothetical protein